MHSFKVASTEKLFGLFNFDYCIFKMERNIPFCMIYSSFFYIYNFSLVFHHSGKNFKMAAPWWPFLTHISFQYGGHDVTVCSLAWKWAVIFRSSKVVFEWVGFARARTCVCTEFNGVFSTFILYLGRAKGLFFLFKENELLPEFNICHFWQIWLHSQFATFDALNFVLLKLFRNVL